MSAKQAKTLILGSMIAGLLFITPISVLLKLILSLIIGLSISDILIDRYLK